jgi:ABC-type antimicrobial peptide transport system permease subunit
VRTSLAEQAVLPRLSAIIHQIDPNLATRGGATMSDRINDSPPAYLRRSSAVVVGVFAVIALMLGVVGLYGVIAYSMSQRTSEIALRMALGAPRSAVYLLVMREAGWLTLSGLALGLTGSIASSFFIRSLLFGVQACDPATLGGIAALLSLASMAAAFLPARRAACSDPVQALRTE